MDFADLCKHVVHHGEPPLYGLGNNCVPGSPAVEKVLHFVLSIMPDLHGMASL